MRIKLRLPVWFLKTGEVLKYVILPAIIFFAVFAGSVIYFEIRQEIETVFSKVDLLLISAGILLILYTLYEVIPGLICLNTMRKSQSGNNDNS